jgi:hypothetical protein
LVLAAEGGNVIIYECDICTKQRPTRSMISHLNAFPLGWLTRYGRTAERTEVRVYVCSKACAKKYDFLEAEQIGGAWHEALPNKETPIAFPLKPKAAKRTT